MTVAIILGTLFFCVTSLPININPFIEMGGTKEYGKLIIECLYVLGFGIGIFPIIEIILNFKFTQFFDSYLFSNYITTITLGDFTNIVQETLDQINDISIESFSKYYMLILYYFFLVFFALVIIWKLHYQIKKRKDEVISKIETKISYIESNEIINNLQGNRNCNLLFIYHKLLNLHEWPVKKFFVFDLIISAMLLFIYRLLGL